MTVYFVDDGGSNTDPFETWAKAATSIQSLDSAKALASGDIIYIGADSNCTDAGAALSITGPTSGVPISIISSDISGGGSTVSYSVGTGNQILATGGAYDITFAGSFALYGIKIVAGRDIIQSANQNRKFLSRNCTYVLGSGGRLQVGGNASSITSISDTVSLAADSGAQTAVVLYSAGSCIADFYGLTFSSATNRTGQVVGGSGGSTEWRFSGCDFSGFTNAADVEIFDINLLRDYSSANNCKTKSGALWLSSGTQVVSTELIVTNSGTADDPTYLAYYTGFGSAVSSTSVYRSGGATIETVPVSWLVTTNSYCSEGSPLYLPWMYGTTTSGSKTWTVYIENTTGDFTDAEVWLEVDFMATTNVPTFSTISDQRNNNSASGGFLGMTTAAVAQTDDSSTWVSENLTYKQALVCTATVGESEGQYRARVCVGLASIAGSRKFYVDPLVTVS